jgi:acyl-CoA reductase-like NAD-dependent aldehyde dehydrogenase
VVDDFLEHVLTGTTNDQTAELDSKVNARMFAMQFAALLDGLSIQVALDDPEVDSDLAYDIAMRCLEPTVVAGLRQDDELVQSEIFGPVITVQSYRGDDEALAMANGVEQGLTASVWTDSHSRAMRFLRDLDFGAVSVNAHAPMGSELPHGGSGSSGYGKDRGLYGLDDYTRIKHVAHAF